MSVISSGNFDKYHHSDPEPERKAECFFCYKSLVPPYVLWMGNGDFMRLHPACVMELFLRLSRDVWQIECESPASLVMVHRKGKALPPKLILIEDT